eukprot:scaffold6688_cov181-Amphora_coffeaeformis.AAC.5
MMLMKDDREKSSEDSSAGYDPIFAVVANFNFVIEPSLVWIVCDDSSLLQAGWTGSRHYTLFPVHIAVVPRTAMGM